MSMKQFRLVPSGCQEWHAQVMGSGGNWFAYCSTLAIYVYNLDTFVLEKLLTGHVRTITGLSWSPHSDELFATCSNDGRLIVWSAATGKIVQAMELDGEPSIATVEWSPVDENLLVIADASTKDTPGSVYIVDISDPQLRVPHKFRFVHKDRQELRVLRWNRHQPGILASGHADGSLCLYVTDPKPKMERMTVKNGTAVVDLRWDALSAYYLIVAYRAGDISLWDMESSSELLKFDRQGAGLRAVAWMEWAPGNFATVNNRTGVIRVWNASQKSPLELVRVSRCGFNSLTFVPGTQKALVSFTDGSIGVFCMEKRQMEFQGLPGHIETIFDLRYRPSCRDTLATASYDSTVKIWYTPTMECKLTLAGQEGVLYGLSWSPDQPRLVSASSTGEIVIWDTDRGRIDSRWKHHNKPVFRVDWNKLDSNLIATSGGDGHCIVQTPKGQIIKDYTLPAAVYGCHWCPFNKSMLATGCHDGLVRVFDVSLRQSHPARVLTGHKRRAFNTVWSPLQAHVLASGSDDKTIRVWDVTSGESKVLHGHKHCVRALVWSTELPHILLSGSWDGTIRVWNTNNEACLSVVTDHHADVYGLDSHPERPFVFASSSRDTTLRFWTLKHEGEGFMIRSLLDHSLSNILRKPDDADSKQEDDADAPAVLHGAASQVLAKQVAGSKQPADRHAAICSFFMDANGMPELWALVRRMLSNSPSDANTALRMHHIDDVAIMARADGAEHESQRYKRRSFGVNALKREDHMRVAAQRYLQVGDIRKYCELMIALEEWVQALAVAPAHSMQYWQSLSRQYADHLAAQQRDAAIPHYIACGAVDELVKFYENRGQMHHAVLIAQVAANGGYPSQTAAGAGAGAGAPSAASNVASAGTNSGEPAPSAGAGVGAGAGAADDDTDTTPSSAGATGTSPVAAVGHERVVQLLNKVASDHSGRSDTVFGACAYLSMGDSRSAINCLLLGGEIALAYAVADALGLSDTDAVLHAVGRRLEELGLVKEAIRVLRRMSSKGATDEAAFVAARYVVKHSTEAATFFQECELPSQDSFLERAKVAKREKRPQDAVRCLAIGGKYAEAVSAACTLWAEAFAGDWNMPLAEHIADSMSCVPAHALDAAVRAHLLAYMCLVGGMRAMWNRYTRIVPSLFEAARELIQAFSLGFPVTSSKLVLMAAQYLYGEGCLQSVIHLLRAHVGHSTSVDDNESKEGGAVIDPDLDECTKLLRAAHEELGKPNAVDASSSIGPHEMIISSSHLPTGTGVANAHVSIITNKIIDGPAVKLDDGSSYVSVDEAAMWARVNPFSPLNTGRRMAPTP